MRWNVGWLFASFLLQKLKIANSIATQPCQLILVNDGINSSNDNTTNNSRSGDISWVTSNDEETRYPKTRSSRELLIAKNRIAVTQLAVQHLAQRDASIVSAIADMACTVNFTLNVVLAESHLDAVRGIVRQLSRLEFRSEDPTAVQNDEECVAIVGPFQRRSIVDTRAVTQSLFVPQVTVGIANPRVEVYPQTALLRNNNVLTTISLKTAVFYWNDYKVPRNFVSFIYDVVGVDTIHTAQPLSQLEDNNEVKVFPMATTSVSTREGLLDVVTDTLRLVKEIGHHTIIAAFEDFELMLPLVAEVADELGLVGDEYLWTFLNALDEETFPLQRSGLRSITPETNSSLYELLLGSAVIRPLDLFQWKNPQGDAFLKSWRSQNKSLKLENAEEVQLEDDFFQIPSNGPLVATSFLYDAVLSLGFHLCLEKDSDEPLLPPFEGASGFVEYTADSDYSRTPSSVPFGLFNIRAASDNEEGLQVALVSIRESTEWRAHDTAEFIFHDGTTNPPTPLRNEGDRNYIARPARIIGLLGMTVSISLSVAAALWVWVYRTQSVVKAGQPEFLILLCLGAFITSLSVYPASLDEGGGFDTHQLDAACMSVPWLFCLGSITIVSALFTKLWRINKLFQFKRRNVTVFAVLGPFVVFLVSSILILTMWTISYPLRWTRVELSRFPYVTTGACDGDHIVAFAAPLLNLTMAPTILTAIMAWKTRDIPGEYSQTQWIFNALLAMSQLWVVGLPVYVILGTQDTNVYFLGLASMAVVYSLSAVTLVIGPKIYTVWIESRSGGKSSSRVRSSQQDSGGLVGQGGIFVSGLTATSNGENTMDEARISPMA